MKEFYIYPRGAFGRVLGGMIEFCENNIENSTEINLIESDNKIECENKSTIKQKDIFNIESKTKHKNISKSDLINSKIKAKSEIESIAKIDIESKNESTIKQKDIFNIESKNKNIKSKIKINFIDDSEEEICLQKQAEQIRQSGAKVLLARHPGGLNENTITLLRQNLEKQNLPYEINATEIYAQKTIKKLKEITLKRKWQNTIAIQLSGFGGDKHSGFLDEFLLQKSQAQIIYLCHLEQSYKRVVAKIAQNGLQSRAVAVFLPFEYFNKIDFVRAICVCGTKQDCPKNPKIPTFYLGHGMTNWSTSDEKWLNAADFIAISMRGYEYPCAENLEFHANDANFSFVKTTIKDSIESKMTKTTPNEKERESDAHNLYSLNNKETKSINYIKSNNIDSIKKHIESKTKNNTNIKDSIKSNSQIFNIPCGYLGFDKIAKEVENLRAALNKNNTKNIESINIIESNFTQNKYIQKIKNTKKAIVFAPYDNIEMKEFLALMKAALNNDYAVICRSRGIVDKNWAEPEMKNAIEELLKYPNFELDSGWEMDASLYLRAFCFVGGKTTSCISFPIISLAPSIVMYEKRIISEDLGVKFNEILKPKSFLEQVKKISQNQKQWAQKILNFRENNIYNYSKASEVLAKFMIDFLDL